MTFTPGPWWKSYDLGTYEIRADGGVIVAKECTLENATVIESEPDMLAALLAHEREIQLNDICSNRDPSASLEWMAARDEAVAKCTFVLKRLRDAGVIAEAEESA